MAISYNSSIVTSNLIACFDPGNPRTYSGSGTALRDASGNGYTGTLVNGPTYSTDFGGVFVLDGVNDYISMPGINLTSTNYTVIGASRYFGGGATGRIITSITNNWLLGHWSSSTQNYYAEGWVSPAAATGGNDTNWRIYAGTGNISGDSYSMYVNGVLNVGPNGGGAAGPNGIVIGAFQGASEFSSCQMGVLLVYNTVLTEAQIMQNFNAYRGRYGL